MLLDEAIHNAGMYFSLDRWGTNIPIFPELQLVFGYEMDTLPSQDDKEVTKPMVQYEPSMTEVWTTLDLQYCLGIIDWVDSVEEDINKCC